MTSCIISRCVVTGYSLGLGVGLTSTLEDTFTVGLPLLGDYPTFAMHNTLMWDHVHKHKPVCFYMYG